MKIELQPNEMVDVTFANTDGVIQVSFAIDGSLIRVHSDLPDSLGRHGVIYEENGAEGMVDGLKTPACYEPVAKGETLRKVKAIEAEIMKKYKAQDGNVTPQEFTIIKNIKNIKKAAIKRFDQVLETAVELEEKVLNRVAKPKKRTVKVGRR